MLTIFVRSVLLFVAAVASMRAMGKRQVGQLQPYELVVVIMIAELAATPMGSLGTPLLYGLLPMAALIVCHGLLTALCMRFERFRTLVDGKPTVLIRHGAICEKQLRKSGLTLNELMEALRSGGVMDPAQVGTAVLETAGNITVFPQAAYRPVCPDDMHLSPAEEGLPLPLILDGHVQGENLHRGGWDQAWLMEYVKKLGYGAPEEILFLCVNTGGTLLCQGKGKTETQRMQVMAAGKARW